MRVKKHIGVILNLPDTPEGMERFNQAMDNFNSRLVAYVLNKYPIPRSQKRAYIESLNGIPPWAGEQKR